MQRLNKLTREMLGKPMTKKEREFLEVLRTKVKSGEITVAEGHRIWDKKILKKKKSLW